MSTECKDCKFREGDCGYHHTSDGVTNYDIASLSACDKYGNCMFFERMAENKGDLISRDALKEHIKNAFKHNFNGYDALLVNEIYEFIDNAPTVEQNWRFYYDHGYAQAKRDFERPHGEWVTNMTTGDIFCSFCKEVRRDTRIRHINFCNSCGADMRGEAKQ